MKKCIVIGGGFAGLSAASFLANKNYHIELIEATPKLGGRAYSFLEQNNNDIIDNGQHILMGCYKHTLSFLNLIDAMDKLTFQKYLEINFINKNNKLFKLKASKLFYPFNLIYGIMNYNYLSLSEKINVIKFFISIFFENGKKLSVNIDDWLTKKNQNTQIKKSLWNYLAIGAFNCSLEKVSAKIFLKIIKEIFLKGNFNSTIILPKVGLSELYCLPAQEFIFSKNGLISLNEELVEIKFENNKAIEIITNKRIINNFDYLILAIPPFALQKIFGYKNLFDDKLFNYEYSSILTFHIWLKHNSLKENFYGLIDSPLHWVFNHNSHITTVISDANDLINKDKDELFNLVWTEIENYFQIKKEEILDYKIIKEKRATFIPSNEALKNRPDIKTKMQNVFLAGDWIETGLPATIESAVMSAKMVADYIQKI
ncbi:MAG: hydroxysqualene dehydroxylase HpnE [Ignavibacterium sp.]